MRVYNLLFTHFFGLINLKNSIVDFSVSTFQKFPKSLLGYMYLKQLYLLLTNIMWQNDRVGKNWVFLVMNLGLIQRGEKDERLLSNVTCSDKEKKQYKLEKNEERKEEAHQLPVGGKPKYLWDDNPNKSSLKVEERK